MKYIIFFLSAGLLLSSCEEFYFAFTSFSGAPQHMNVKMPTEDSATKHLNIKNTITLLLYKDKVYGYPGNNITMGKQFSYSPSSVSAFIKASKFSLGEKLFVFIKPAENSTYKNTVNTLDEMSINDIKKYSMTDLTDKERQLIKSLQ